MLVLDFSRGVSGLEILAHVHSQKDLRRAHCLTESEHSCVARILGQCQNTAPQLCASTAFETVLTEILHILGNRWDSHQNFCC